MGPRDIERHIRRKPFRPFRIRTNDGESYDVRHPEMARVDLHEVTVGLTTKGGFIDEKIFLSLQNVASIELLNEPIGAPSDSD